MLNTIYDYGARNPTYALAAAALGAVLLLLGARKALAGRVLANNTAHTDDAEVALEALDAIAAGESIVPWTNVKARLEDID